jgi:hypothetical protein
MQDTINYRVLILQKRYLWSIRFRMEQGLAMCI